MIDGDEAFSDRRRERRGEMTGLMADCGVLESQLTSNWYVELQEHPCPLLVGPECAAYFKDNALPVRRRSKIKKAKL